MEPMTTSEAVRILGLRGPVDAADVKRAYRELARQHHPDRGGDVAVFQQVQAAYDALRTDLPSPGEGPADAAPAPSVADRWWESSTRWHEGPVDTAGVDWETTIPSSAPYPLSRDRLAVLLAETGEGPVAPLVARSRAPGSWLHAIIGWLQPDLLAELQVHPARDEGIEGHDVEVRLAFRSFKARRIINEAGLPQGWIKHRGSSSTTVRRSLHPSVTRQATAARTARLVAEMTEAAGWPLDDWYVVADGGSGPAQRDDR